MRAGSIVVGCAPQRCNPTTRWHANISINKRVNHMRYKFKIVSFLILPVCIHLSLSLANSSAGSSTAAAEIPIFSGGYHVNRHLDDSRQTVTVNYRVQTIHPAAEVLEFYDQYFNGKGWISSFETCQRNWADLGETANTSKSPVRLVFASWEHAESNRKVLLWIRHEWQSDQRQDEVVVEYRLQPITEKK